MSALKNNFYIPPAARGGFRGAGSNMKPKPKPNTSSLSDFPALGCGPVNASVVIHNSNSNKEKASFAPQRPSFAKTVADMAVRAEADEMLAKIRREKDAEEARFNGISVAALHARRHQLATIITRRFDDGYDDDYDGPDEDYDEDAHELSKDDAYFDAMEKHEMAEICSGSVSAATTAAAATIHRQSFTDEEFNANLMSSRRRGDRGVW